VLRKLVVDNLMWSKNDEGVTWDIESYACVHWTKIAWVEASLVLMILGCPSH
jgi:hypothetical protein